MAYTVFAISVVISFVSCTTAKECVDQDWSCLTEVTQRKIRELKWRQAAVIYDNETVLVLQELQEVKTVAYEVENGTPLQNIFREIHTMLFPEVNVILAVKSALLLIKIIHEADTFDITDNHSTDFSHHSKWLVFTEDFSIFLNGSVKVTNLQNIALSQFNCGKTVHCPRDYSLTSVAGDFRFLPVNPTLPFPLMTFPNTLYGYNGLFLRVSTVESTPFVIPGVGGGDVPYTGYCIDILHIITKQLNISVEYVAPEDGIWGWVDNGVVGQLKRREIDLAASELAVHAARAQHVDFITPHVYTDERVFSYKMPPATQPLFLLAGPLKPSVYLVYIGVSFTVIIIIVLMETFGHFRSTRRKKRVHSLFWELLKPSLKQSPSLNMLNNPGRLLLAFWWLLILLFSSVYCGNLTATLAMNVHLMKFRSIDELAESDFGVGFLRGGILPQLLKNSTREDIKRVYARFVTLNASDPKLTSDSKEELLQKVKDGQYAYASYKSMVEIQIQKDCNLSLLYFGDKTKTPLGFAVQKNSPFRDDINKVMQKLDSSGVLNKLWEKWTNYSGNKMCSGRKTGVTVTELIGGVIVSASGIGLATVSLLLEHVITWRK